MRPAARRRKTFFAVTAAGKPSLTLTVLDLALNVRLVSVMILGLVALAAVELTMDEAFYIYEPVVIGNQRVPSAEIIAASQIEGLHIFWLQPTQVAQTILTQLPDLREANVWCELPAECTIHVVERQPAFEWQQGQIRLWVDDEAVAFLARSMAPDVPVLEAVPGAPALLPGRCTDDRLVRTMLGLIQALPQVKLYRFTNEHGIEFTDPQGDWPVYIGLGTDVAERVAVWRALSASLTARHIHPKFVDVHYPSAPFYVR